MANYPIPTSIQNVDICRDGGTYVMVCSTTNGGTCELELLVRMNHNYDRVGYWPPTLLIHQSNIKIQLNWDDAEHLAKILSKLLHPHIDWGGSARAREMIAHLQAKGTLKATD